MKTESIQKQVESLGYELVRDESTVSYTDIYGTDRLRSAHEWLIRKNGGYVTHAKTPAQAYKKLRTRLDHPAPGPVAPAAVVPTSAPLNDGKALG